jgi:hypothetical protein
MHQTHHFLFIADISHRTLYCISPYDPESLILSAPRDDRDTTLPSLRDPPGEMVSSSRKRGRQEMEAVEPPKERSLLDRIRNMWEFANLAQWLFIFGRAVKIDENLDIEVGSSLSAIHINPHRRNARY